MFPRVKIEDIDLGKVVCGTNQFVGITHRWNPFDMLLHLIRFRKAKTVAKYMEYLFREHGVNSCVSSPREKVRNAIRIVEKKVGEKFHWICTPSVRTTVKGFERDIFKQIDWCAEQGVTFCGPHRMYTDNALDMQDLKIGGPEMKEQNSQMFKGGLISQDVLANTCAIPYPEIAEYIRDKGMIPMLSSHYIETIEAVEKQGYDAQMVIQPFNKKGFESNTDPAILARKIKNTKVRILNIKPMAAGRIPPREGLAFCAKTIKKKDLLVVGFGKYKYAVEDGKILEKLFS